jgi:hypothetical protein
MHDTIQILFDIRLLLGQGVNEFFDLGKVVFAAREAPGMLPRGGGRDNAGRAIDDPPHGA